VKYGKFIAAIIKFLFTAAVLFIVIQSVNRVSKKEAAKPVPTPEEIALLREIRDSLKNRH
ncbi:MAG: large conductance mechanosensitive channel protein MscL, partial [Chitinophagaceae bacterium]|nr:large conductance mechanosensitive channel protein MscL [Chitinophagaceae bacterium]